MLEAIDRLDSALPITDSGVVNDRVERSQAVGLIGESPRLGDALEIAYHHSVGLRGRSLRVAGTTPVAGVEDHLVTSGQQPLRRTSLQALRLTIQGIIPRAEECISYGMPAFRLEGKVIAGFAAFKNHLAYLPHSGSVFGELADDLAGYESTPGSLHFPIDKPPPKSLVKKLIATRLEEVRKKRT